MSTQTSLLAADDAPLANEPQAMTPMALIQSAIEQKLDVEQLGKLFDLQERWEKNCAKQAYAAAMTAAQSEMAPVVRVRENKQQGSKYAALEDIHETIKPIWLKHKFTLSYGSDRSPYEGHYRVTCDCLHEGGHATHHVLDGPGDDKGLKGNANKTPIQAAVSTVSYLRRSLAVMIFDITIVGQDCDGQGSAESITEEQCVTLQEWIAQKNVNAKKFLDWLGVERLGDVPAAKYQMAIDALKRK